MVCLTWNAPHRCIVERALVYIPRAHWGRPLRLGNAPRSGDTPIGDATRVVRGLCGALGRAQASVAGGYRPTPLGIGHGGGGPPAGGCLWMFLGDGFSCVGIDSHGASDLP